MALIDFEEEKKHIRGLPRVLDLYRSCTGDNTVVSIQTNFYFPCKIAYVTNFN